MAEEIAQKFDLPFPTIPLAPGVDTEGDNTFQPSPVTSDDVNDITTMHSNKAPGNDTIYINVLKDCLSNSIVYPITSLINSSFATGSFPRQWKQSVIIAVPKNNDHEEQ